jgi:hypothetical protein
MADIFGSNSTTVWVVILAAALFYPVRQLIWALSVRREERREGKTDEETRQALKRRANITAILLSFVFAYFYATTILSGD